MKKNILIVGGCGHIGLPLGVLLALRTQGKVSLYDTNKKNINLINKGVYPYVEENGEKFLKLAISKKKILATDDIKKVKESNIIIITLGTPVDEFNNPILDDILNFLHSVKSSLKSKTIIFRSTLYPGSFNLIERIIIENFKIKNLKLAYCPERVAQGFSIKEISELPQIISGNSNQAIKESKILFSKLTEKLITLKPIEAELTKIFSNTWRYSLFGISNQFLKISSYFKADYRKIIDAAKIDYPRMNSLPGPGLAAGPCLYKDTAQLSSASDVYASIFRELIAVNESMPEFYVNNFIEKFRPPLNSKILLLGMTFKKDNDDIRTSLSFKIKKIFTRRGFLVYFHDPYLNQKIENNHVLDLDKLYDFKYVFIAMNHTYYEKVKFKSKQKIYRIW